MNTSLGFDVENLYISFHVYCGMMLRKLKIHNLSNVISYLKAQTMSSNSSYTMV